MVKSCAGCKTVRHGTFQLTSDFAGGCKGHHRHHRLIGRRARGTGWHSSLLVSCELLGLFFRGSGNSIMAISAFFIPVGRGASETLSVRRSASGVTSRTSMVIVVMYVRIFEWRDGSRQRTLNKTGLLVRFADQLSLERWREKVV